MKRFLVIQLRPEDKAADNELEAFMQFGGLEADEIHRIQADREPIPEMNVENYAAIIIGGGPSNVSDKDKNKDLRRMEDGINSVLDQVTKKDIPYLGACYGFGALIAHQGSVISKDKYSEQVGAMSVSLTPAGKIDPLLIDLPEEFRVFGGHKEACQSLPAGMVLLAGSADCPVQMVKLKNNIYATQFHPELDTHGIMVRIHVYKNAGYFPPESADALIESVRREKVTVPVSILQRFVDKYRTV